MVTEVPFRKLYSLSLLKSDFRKSDLVKDEKKDCPKVKKVDLPSTSSSPELETDEQEQEQEQEQGESPEDIKKYWNELESGGEIKDLLGSNIVKNTNRMRFVVKTISLKDDET